MLYPPMDRTKVSSNCCVLIWCQYHRAFVLSIPLCGLHALLGMGSWLAFLSHRWGLRVLMPLLPSYRGSHIDLVRSKRYNRGSRMIRHAQNLRCLPLSTVLTPWFELFYDMSWCDTRCNVSISHQGCKTNRVAPPRPGCIRIRPPTNYRRTRPGTSPNFARKRDPPRRQNKRLSKARFIEDAAEASLASWLSQHKTFLLPDTSRIWILPWYSAAVCVVRSKFISTTTPIAQLDFAS
jgi:hypothetical protein